MKYRCSHCNQNFELEDREFKRCPNCFWTTSLAPVQEVNASPEPEVPQVISPQIEVETPKRPKFPLKIVVISFIIIVLVGGLAFAFFKMGSPIPKFSVRLPFGIPREKSAASDLAKSFSKSKSVKQAESLLTSEERTELVRSFLVTIPRQLSEDEEKILKKQISFPASLAEKPKLEIWKKEDFDSMIESEQKKRKIFLGWVYVRSLKRTFEKYYLAGAEALEKGDYVFARERFIKSLTFPVYRNDPKVHRAVALVMLRPYINDVIGKIAVFNQYLSSQSLVTEANGIFSSYQALFPVFDLQEWDRALQLVGEIKKEIEALENRSRETQIDYPPSFRQVDPEIQTAIQSEASPQLDASVSLKSLTVDLGLKEKVVRENTQESLLKVQKQYEQAMQLVEKKDWNAAREAFGAIEYPPELVGEARKKVAVIEKILALEETSKK